MSSAPGEDPSKSSAGLVLIYNQSTRRPPQQLEELLNLINIFPAKCKPDGKSFSCVMLPTPLSRSRNYTALCRCFDPFRRLIFRSIPRIFGS